jgi:hypothetical protein
MKFPFKTLGLLLASLALASCGGGGGDGGSATPSNGTISLIASKVNLPRNPNGVLPFPGSPFTAELSFVFRNNAGQITALTSDATFTVNQPSIVSISPPDDPETEDINELAQRFVSFFDTTNNGTYTLFVTSYDVAGTATVTAGATDPVTGQTVTASINFVVEGAPPNAASVTLSPSPSSIYVAGVGGATSSIISAQVLDGANQPVPDPVGADNVRYELVSDAAGGILSGNSGSGNSVTARTVAGIATVSFQSGTALPPGPVQIRATVDRSDNNVSNGIGDPISATTTVVVSDGKLFSLTLTSPIINALRVNRVSDGVFTPDGVIPVDEDGIPVDPDATYSLTISALAKDRQGAPVVPGTVIRFGVIDEPFDVPADFFSISGSDGNPQEGGTLFTSQSGEFVTGGGGAGPGDVLVVFGEEVQGNSDLESALTVQQINSQTSLNTSSSFNLNNTTGVSVNYGPVLPYVVARAQHGNITASGVTNDIGRASATLNYTISTLGYLNVIWAQGESVDAFTGGAKRVTDAEIGSYPGLAPATISASPSPIIGNTTQQVQVCLVDAMLAPLQRVRLGFSFQLNQGTGSVDGVTGSGLLGSSTGANGCVIANVVTSGLGASTDGAPSGVLTFGLGGLTASVDIVVNLATLQVSPSLVVVGPTGRNFAITISARDTGGNAVSGVAISGACTTQGGATIDPSAFSGITGANGTTVHSGSAAGFTDAGPPITQTGSGQCTYSTAEGLSATVQFVGTGACGFSPCD